jgi:poly(hydroxyalkanoate) depolymerase family esterase
MPTIDWQELYASNRAVIEGHRPASPGVRRAPAEESGPGPAGAWQALETGSRGRAAFVYTPPGLTPDAAAPLVVMLHGCTQTAQSLADGTLMNRAADRHGFVVAYPQQSGEHNPQCCWNWFLDRQQHRDAPEPAFIAGVAHTVAEAGSRWAIDPQRVFVAGMSAGAAMAGVAAATHPDLFAAVALHSGLPFAVARTQGEAFTAMSRGAQDPERCGELALTAMGDRARPMPALVVHGSADRTVAPANAEHTARQWLATNRLASRGDFDGRFDGRFDDPSTIEHGRADGGLAFIRRRWSDAADRPVVEEIVVDGLGHAWSGGAPGGSYTDPRGPSAADAIWRFFARSG